MDLVALRAELDTDPLALGYAGMTDEQAAASLNANGRDVNRTEVTGGEIATSVVRSELAALTAGDQNYIRALISAGVMPITDNLKSEFGAVFGAGTQTRANLLSLLKRPGSRAEELGLARVTPSHVADARRLS